MVIVDTSVALKWFLPEEGSEAARDLVQRESVGSPDLLFYEFSNVLSCQRGLSLEEVQRLLDLLYQLDLQVFLLPQKGFRRAVEISRKFGLSVYDASFVALAESMEIDFITADRKLARRVRPLSFVREL